MHVSTASLEKQLFVPETKFGVWFLGTDTWFNFVLKEATFDLQRLIGDKSATFPVIVDVGCGRGRSFRLLHMTFRPTRLIGVEMDEENVEVARARAKQDRVKVELLTNDCAAIDLPDDSADLVFCHQTFHHLVQQERALSEFHRILKPGGLLLFAESTKAYIHSWIIRWLFAHPMDVQRTAEQYVAMVRAAGFELADDKVSYPYLWWSRSDFGVAERFGVRPKAEREETLVNLVARKPRL